MHKSLLGKQEKRRNGRRGGKPQKNNLKTPSFYELEKALFF